MSRPQSYPLFRAYDDNNEPLTGGKVYTYAVGTTTAKATYSDRALSVANANPIILDSNGEAVIYISGPTKIILKDSSDVTLWTQDWVGDDTQDVVNASRYGTSGSQAAIDAAITAIGSDYRTLYISPGTWSITTDTTIPANVTVKMEAGAKFSVATTKTLTILGPIEPGPTQIFDWSGTGAIDIDCSPTRDCYLQWWGAVAGITNDCAAALTKAYASTKSQRIRITEGVWRIASTVTCIDNTGPVLWGDGKSRSRIYIDVGAGNNGLVFGDGTNADYNTRIKGIAFTGPAAACLNGLVFYRQHYMDIEDVHISTGAAEYACLLRECTAFDAEITVSHAAQTIDGAEGAVPANGIKVTRGTSGGVATNASRLWCSIGLYGATAPTGLFIGGNTGVNDMAGASMTIEGVVEAYDTGIPFYAENWNFGYLHNLHIEGTGTSTLKHCRSIYVEGYHGYGTNQTLSLDNCENVTIENSDMAALTIDADSRGTRLGNIQLINVNGMTDSAPDTFYYGAICARDGTLPRYPYNQFGSNPKNLFDNVAFNRWRTDRPDGWSKEGTTAWTQCGVGLGDTIRHDGIHSAKAVVTASTTNYYTPSADVLRMIIGKYITFTIWVYITAEYATYPAVYIFTSGGATNPTFLNNMSPVVAADVTTWKKVTCAGFIPADCTGVLIKTTHYVDTGAASGTVYFADPCLSIGRLPSRGLLRGEGEFQDFVQIGANKVTYGTAAPSAAGVWYQAGDVCWNTSTALPSQLGWQCKTSGIAGASVWRSIPNVVYGSSQLSNLGGTTTTVSSTAVLATSAIIILPTHAETAAAFGNAASVWVSTKTPDTSFVVTHPATPGANETFDYVIIN